jgi:hypothetical protein
LGLDLLKSLLLENHYDTKASQFDVHNTKSP